MAGSEAVGRAAEKKEIPIGLVRDTVRPGQRRRHISPSSLQLVALVLCAVLAIALVVSYVMLLRGGAAGIKQTDFVAYYSGSHLVLSGHASQLYSFPALGRFEAQLVHPLQVRHGVLPFVYPPFFALFLAPLAALPYPAAYGLWLLINGGLLVATVAALGRYAGLGARGMALLGAACLSFLPVFVCLVQGQTSLLLLALLTTTLLSCRWTARGPGLARGDLLAGCALGLALVKPPLVVPFLLTLILRRRWRALGGFAMTVTILVVVPTLLLGIPVTDGYGRTLLRATAWHDQFGYGPVWNHSLAGFAQLLLPGPAWPPATAGLILGALVLLACATRSREIDLALGVSCLVAILISPHVLIHDLSILLLPVAVALRYRPPIPLGLTAVLVLGYLAILLGLRTIDVVRLQLSVLAMVALALWLVNRGMPLRPTLPPGSVSRAETLLSLTPIPAHLEDS